MAQLFRHEKLIVYQKEMRFAVARSALLDSHHYLRLQPMAPRMTLPPTLKPILKRHTYSTGFVEAGGGLARA